MKPVFPYPGGKSKLLKSVLPFVPRKGVQTYCEPFAGGLAVLLAHDEAFPREVVNDLNAGLMAFYRMAAFHPDALLTELSGFVASRSDFNMELRFPDSKTELGRAARWFWVTKQSFGAKGKHFGRGKDIFNGVDAVVDEARIREFSTRVRSVIFRNTDACAVIRDFDAPDTFFFLDPPYVECSDTAYDAFSEADMSRLRDTLADCKGRWLLTCDDSPSTRRVFAGYPARGNEIKYSLCREKSGKVFSELMIFSENLAAEYPGQTMRLTPAQKSSDEMTFFRQENAREI